MSAAEVLTSLAAAGAELVAEPAGLRVLAPVRLPGALLAAARDVKPALLRVASGRWRLDLAGWPGWRVEFFLQRGAALVGVVSPEQAERQAYAEAAALTAPPGPAPAPARPARLPAHLRDTPEAWAAFLDSAPWVGPAERARILADVAG